MSGADLEPGRRFLASTPVRVADVGGWTDTWFGGPGRVCSIAVRPGVLVEASVVERRADDPSVRLRAEPLGVDLRLEPSPDRGWAAPLGGAGHALLAHAVGEVLGVADVPAEIGIDVHIDADVPPGASLGTSASVVVAVLGALDAVVDRRRSPAEVAVAAHRVETERAGREAGVQDQWAAALGGCQLLAVDEYPTVQASEVVFDHSTIDALSERMVTVVLGSHDSSAIHRQVIGSLESGQRGSHRVLARLRRLAAPAAEALGSGDLAGWGQILIDATDLQAELHPELIGDAHQAAIAVARATGAAGWKVNGAGGAGGSLTVLAPVGGSDEVRAALADVDPSWILADLHVGRGLEVREADRSS